MEIIPNPRIMLLVFIVFLVTMFVLNKFVFQPLIAFMDDREAKVNKDLQLASEDDKELIRIENEITKILTEAKTQAFNFKDEQIQQAKEVASQKILKAQAENKEKMEAFVAKLKQDREQIKQEFRSHLGDLESLLASKIKNL